MVKIHIKYGDFSEVTTYDFVLNPSLLKPLEPTLSGQDSDPTSYLWLVTAPSQDWRVTTPSDLWVLTSVSQSWK